LLFEGFSEPDAREILVYGMYIKKNLTSFVLASRDRRVEKTLEWLDEAIKFLMRNKQKGRSLRICTMLNRLRKVNITNLFTYFLHSLIEVKCRGVFMAEDKELERIKSKKLREILEQNVSKEKEKLIQDREPSVFNKPVEVTDATLMGVVERNPLVVVDCWAPWCAPCQFVGPIIEELAWDYAGKVLFGKLNVDENPVAATQYEIMGIPTLLVFKNGKLVDRIVGAMPREMLEPRIARYLKS